MPSAVGPFRPIILISAFSASSLEDSSGREDSGWLADTSVSEDSGAEEVAAPHPAKGRDSAAKAGKTKSKKDLAYTIAMVVFAVIFLVSGGLFVFYEAAISASIGLAASSTQTVELSMVNYLWPSLTVLLNSTAMRGARGFARALPGAARLRRRARGRGKDRRISGRLSAENAAHRA